MAEFSLNKTAEKLADFVLDNYEYKGKTIREWADILCTIDFPDLEHATEEKNCNTCGQKCAIKYHGCSNWKSRKEMKEGE